MTISPYVKQPGMIDKQVLSFDAYAKFIEDLFLGGQRLDPKTDGRPDPRPDVREASAQLGDLMTEFDFAQNPAAADAAARISPARSGVDAAVTSGRQRGQPCCMDLPDRRSNPKPVWVHATRTEIGRPNSSMWFSTWTAMATSVARRQSVRERNPSLIARL